LAPLFRLLQRNNEGTETLRHAVGRLKPFFEFLRNAVANRGVPFRDIGPG
jgi:hypothetical protein